jgi:hypothetical protein
MNGTIDNSSNHSLNECGFLRSLEGEQIVKMVKTEELNVRGVERTEQVGGPSPAPE